MEIKILPMRNLSKTNQKYICNCEKICKNYFHIGDFGRYCEKYSLEFAYQIINRSKRLHSPQKARGYGTGWRTSEVEYIVDWCATGLKHGDIAIIAENLGRSYGSVKSKMERLRLDGRI